MVMSRATDRVRRSTVIHVVKSQQVPKANGSKAADNIMYPAPRSEDLAHYVKGDCIAGQNSKWSSVH